MSDNKPTGKWANPAFLKSLVLGLYHELKHGGLQQEAKDRVEAKLHRDGFEDTTWDGIRYPSHPLLYTRILSAPPSFLDTTLLFHIPRVIPHLPTKHYTNAIEMSEKSAPGGKWANPALLEALAMGFHSIAKGEGLTKEAKDSVILKIHSYGFTDITWEAVRMAPVTVWNDEARSDLLVALLSVIKPSKEDWDRVLPIVHAKGYAYNANAVQQHIQKLQRKELTAGDGGDGEASSSTTPQKKAGKKAATPKKRKTPLKSKAKVNSEDDEDEVDEEGEQEAPPPKKPRTPARPSMKDEFHEDTKATGTKFVPVNNEI
ncbi:hypothetical protein BDP55DRAFT_712265 [Colletotrichum godetiae]|uniref:Uncharacterized protein n=1 Tax=Colletotrichum godetiae TaxID=1209918 RepID=A0AAJ0AT32_9PEZI|nr:uncharacterized protein BDP55DRAFT_712265 [Colletotrichum godetiae]KAK1689871.1 hypothetical protein BDP55DRAFT_712265 [Colletotrichum godetiae]